MKSRRRSGGSRSRGRIGIVGVGLVEDDKRSSGRDDTRMHLYSAVRDDAQQYWLYPYSSRDGINNDSITYLFVTTDSELRGGRWSST